MMDQNETFNTTLITISQEELTFILRTANLNTLPGFRFPETFSELHAEIVGRTLLARGIATIEDENFVIDEDIAAIVACGSVATRVLTVAYQNDQGEKEQHWFYSIPDLHVYHVPSDYGVHLFQTIDGNMLAVLLLTIMRVEPEQRPATEGQAILVSRQWHDQARQLAQQGHKKEATKLLQQQRLPASLIAAILAPIHQSVVVEKDILSTKLEAIDENGVEQERSIVESDDGGLVISLSGKGQGINLLNHTMFQDTAAISVVSGWFGQRHIKLLWAVPPNQLETFHSLYFKFKIQGKQIIDSNADVIANGTATWHKPEQIEVTLIELSDGTDSSWLWGMVIGGVGLVVVGGGVYWYLRRAK